MLDGGKDMKEEAGRHETVSIVMPVYNPGKYLAPCLDSLLAQTFRDFRLIAIDDGSTDGSGDVLRAYAAKDDRILAWRNPENLGAARTRNIGIQMARGTYLSIVDADDLYAPEYLATMVEVMEQYGVDVAVCDFYDFNDQTGEKIENRLPEFLRDRLEKPFRPEEIPDEIFLTARNNPFSHMFRRAFIAEQSLQFQDIAAWNDLFFSKMGLMLAGSVFRVQRPLACYRFNTGKQISTKYTQKYPCFFHACAAMCSALSARGLFAQYRPAIYEYFVRNMYLLYPALEEAFGASACCRIAEGFRVMGMEQLERKDFPSALSYQFWRQWSQGFPAALEVWDDVHHQAFFRDAAGVMPHAALWGYGKLGREFLQMAERYAFPVEEVYDRDPAKWNENLKPPVKPFSRRSSNVDMVIVTNSQFYAEIKSEVEQADREIYVCDFQSAFPRDFQEYVANWRLHIQKS